MFQIFEKLGGEREALAILKAAEGRYPSVYARADWEKQRRIPPLRAVVLLDECSRRGVPATYQGDCVAPPTNAEAAE